MITANDKRLAEKAIHELRRNPPKITQADREGGERLFKEHQRFEDQKERDIRSETKDFSKDLAGYVHNQINGVGDMFNGIGSGKKAICKFSKCGKHESQMFNMADGKWYCSEHKWFGRLNKDQKQKELCNA